MDKPYYIYVSEDCIEQAKEITDKIRVLNAPGCAVIIIGEHADAEAIRAEVKDAVDKDYALYILNYGKEEFDDEMKLLVMTAKKYCADEEGFNRLRMDLALVEINHYDDKPEKRSIWKIAVIAAVFFTATLLVLWLLKVGIFAK